MNDLISKVKWAYAKPDGKNELPAVIWGDVTSTMCFKICYKEQREEAKKLKTEELERLVNNCNSNWLKRIYNQFSPWAGLMAVEHELMSRYLHNQPVQ